MLIALKGEWMRCCREAMSYIIAVIHGRALRVQENRDS